MVHTNPATPSSKTSASAYVTYLTTKQSEYKDFSTRQTVFINEEIEVDDVNLEVILHISTPEQFIQPFQMSLMSGNGYKVVCLIENNLYFQNDPVFREGFINGFSSRNSDGLIFNSANNNKTIIIQGIQLTGQHFLKSITDNITFNNCYLKDFVFTKTATGSAPFQGTTIFNYCNLSIHIRAFEYGYEFDTSGATWNNCARYIEYSDLVEDSIPTKNSYSIFLGPTQNCSTIARNLALSIEAAHSSVYLINSSINSSWDIELGILKYIDDPESSVQSAGETTQNLYLGNGGAINNCFVSIKALKRIPENYYYSQDVYFKSNTTGVNVYNKGNAGQTTACTAKQNNQVMQLTDSECHDYAVLNKYGFFVNQAYEFELLESEPSDWATNYEDYYRKFGNEYVKIMDVSAPTFAENTFYEKVLIPED